MTADVASACLAPLDAADVGGWFSAAHAWRRLAGGLTARRSDVDARARWVDFVWAGPAAERAVAALDRQRDELAAAGVAAHRIADALLAHAEELSRLRELARGLSTAEYFAAEALATAAAALDARTTEAVQRCLPEPGTNQRVGGIPRRGSDPATVHRWWQALGEADRRWLVAHEPDRIGSLDGVPVADRDAANRLLLTRAQRRIEARIEALDERFPDPVPERDAAYRRLTVLGELASRLDRGDRAVYLMGFDPSGDGLAVVAFGDPDAAAHVLTYVPGTGASLDGLRVELNRTEGLAGDLARARPDGPVATVLWLGYDAPDRVLSAINDGPARAAAGDLERYAAGLRATHSGAAGQHTILGYSYGSTVVGAAGADVDDVILLASPGVAADHAGDLGPARVWAGTATNDLVRHAGHLADPLVPLLGRIVDPLIRNDPTAEGFGGRTFDAGTGTPWSSDPLAAHSDYWRAGSPARQAIADIAAGRR